MDQPSIEWIESIAGILETLNQGVIIGDDCRQIVFANALFLEMTGLTPSESLGKQVETFYPPNDAATLLARIEETRERGHNRFEFYLPGPGGSRTPVIITSRQMEDFD